MRVEIVHDLRVWLDLDHGTRTAEGKARVSRNADRGGQRQTERALIKVWNALLREQREMLSGH